MLRDKKSSLLTNGKIGKKMIYYIFKHQIFTIFLSLSHLTAITFPSKVFDYVGGQEGDFKIYELNKGKSLVFESKKKGFSRNFLAFLKQDKYHFNIAYDESLSNKDVEIKQARTCSYFSILKETKEYQLFECPRSLFFINKLKKEVRVNDQIIKDRSYLSKGPPIYVNKKLIYVNGRVL